jgi:hypothetical protein
MGEVRKVFELGSAVGGPAPAGPEPPDITAVQDFAFGKTRDGKTDWPNRVDRRIYRSQLASLRETVAKAGPETALGDVTLIFEAVQDDFRQLMQEAAAKGTLPYLPLLLLDDVHLYAPVMLTILQNIGAAGLGTGHLPIPVVFTYMTTTTDGDRIRTALRKMSIADERQPELAVFKEINEQRLAYGQLLLSWKQCTPNDRSKNAKRFLDLLQQRTEGRVKNVITPGFESLIDGGAVK